jgi:hypothetical protein
MVKRKRTNNDLQNTTQKTKDWATQTQLKTFDLQNMITPLVSFDHCVVCPSIYRLWLSLWYLLTIVFSVIQGLTCLMPLSTIFQLWSVLLRGGNRSHNVVSSQPHHHYLNKLLMNDKMAFTTRRVKIPKG